MESIMGFAFGFLAGSLAIYIVLMWNDNEEKEDADA